MGEYSYDSLEKNGGKNIGPTIVYRRDWTLYALVIGLFILQVVVIGCEAGGGYKGYRYYKDTITPIIDEIQYAVDSIVPIINETRPIVEQYAPILKELAPIIRDLEPDIKKYVNQTEYLIDKASDSIDNLDKSVVRFTKVLDIVEPFISEFEAGFNNITKVYIPYSMRVFEGANKCLRKYEYMCEGT